MATTTSAPRTKDAPAKDEMEADAKGGADAKPKGKKKLIIGVVLLVLLGGGYKKTIGKAEVDPHAAPEPGIVLKLDPITLNLAGGSYLKLRMALQFTADAVAGGEGADEPDGAQAMDLAIAHLSNRKLADFDSAAARARVKEKLLKAVAEAYDSKVMNIYFTEFVMQ